VLRKSLVQIHPRLLLLRQETEGVGVAGVASAEVQSVVASACVYCIQAATNYSSQPMRYIFLRNIHNLYDMYVYVCM